MDIKKLLGKKIKRLRIKNQYTQEQFAEFIDISQRTLSGIETGENFISSETLNKILEAFKVTPGELFAVDHLRATDELVEEIFDDINSIKDSSEKIEYIYKVVKAIIND